MEKTKGPVCLRWEGRLDASHLPRLLTDFPKVQNRTQVELYLDRCESMESPVFSLLTQLIRTVWSVNGKITLYHPTPRVLQKLRDSRLDKAVIVVESDSPHDPQVSQ